MHGSISYAAQEPWILSESLRSNILFGKTYEPEWYHQVVMACQLERDFELLGDGDLTEVGERGVTLSGGQRARISLARAVYAKASIILLDDPLSACDVTVAQNIFESCITGILKGSTVVLVMHQLQFMTKVDQIVLLSPQGKMLGSGTYAELDSRGLILEDLLSSPRRDCSNSEGGKASIHSLLTPSRSASKVGQQLRQSEIVGQKSNPSPLFEKESRKQGSISTAAYSAYADAIGSKWMAVLIFLLCLLAQCSLVMADWFLSRWVSYSDNTSGSNIGIYSALVACTILFSFVRTFTFMSRSVFASKYLHDRAFLAVLQAPVHFFDVNPVGRVLNRFSMDLNLMDDALPITLLDFLQSSINIIGMLILIGAINPWIFIIIGPLGWVFVKVRRYYLQTSREIKRLEATSRSPIYSLFNASLAGLVTIRTYNAEKRFLKMFQEFQTVHAQAYFNFVVVSRWLGFRLDILSWIVVTITIIASFLAAGSLTAGQVGLSLAYALQLTVSFQWCVRQSAEVENQMTSVERLTEYSSLIPEMEPVKPLLEQELQNWPSHGNIEFRDVSLSYSVDGPTILSNLTCSIGAKEKIGIVGRTGAGKSSLISTLFRLANVRGSILIDGIDTSNVSLNMLRKNISVIPQDPVLFGGSIRNNLDPFNTCDDISVWRALEDVHLRKVFEDMATDKNMGLSVKIAEGGSNLSVGQRQLVCLARAILRTNRILILDEATANIDSATDNLIQITIREKFADWTVLTVAHRINTVMSSDRIMVLDSGSIVEFDTPSNLMNIVGGYFSGLVAHT